MSVFTAISKNQVENILSNYSVSKLHNFCGIEAGVTNSNFQLNTRTTTYLLTIFETHTAKELKFYLDLMAFLAQKGITCPKTIKTSQGETILQFKNKPIVLIEWLPGKTLTQVNTKQCAALGRALAELHLAAKGFAESHCNQRGLVWQEQIFQRINAVVPANERRLLTEEMQYAQACANLDLPRGIIHADLFRDNVLFVENNITGLIDFYFACEDYYLLDLATCINDWCWNGKSIDVDYYQILLQAYQSQRKLQAGEINKLPSFLRLAALRFWLSRLADKYFAPSGQVVQAKDPIEMQSIIEWHRQNHL